MTYLFIFETGDFWMQDNFTEENISEVESGYLSIINMDDKTLLLNDGWIKIPTETT